MKNPERKFLLTFSILLLVSFSAQAQKGLRQASCYNETLKLQADSLKSVLNNQGFIVVKEATMTMESEYEMPVVVPLAEGSWYHIAFIGDMSSKLYEVRMYDYDEKQLVYQKKYAEGYEGGNIINYSYIPKFSEYHMIKPVQVNKKQKSNLCGYFIIFKKIN